MKNNQVKIMQDNSIGLIFRFSDIIGLIYSEHGFYAKILFQGQEVLTPVRQETFADASKYIAENVKHCKECGYRLHKQEIMCDSMLVETLWNCPKCEGHDH